jgi:hypothetical protein
MIELGMLEPSLRLKSAALARRAPNPVAANAAVDCRNDLRFKNDILFSRCGPLSGPLFFLLAVVSIQAAVSQARNTTRGRHPNITYVIAQAAAH